MSVHPSISSPAARRRLALQEARMEAERELKKIDEEYNAKNSQSDDRLEAEAEHKSQVLKVFAKYNNAWGSMKSDLAPAKTHLTPEYKERMEDVLALYERPFAQMSLLSAWTKNPLSS